MSIRVVSLFLLALIALSSTQATAQRKGKGNTGGKQSTTTKAPKGVDPNTVLATVGGENITYREVEAAYKRNMNRKNSLFSDVRRDSALDFISKLYVNYRLKVREAYSRGFDKDSTVMNELNSNKKMLSETYLFDKKVTEPNIEKCTERRKKEIKIGVMVFAIPQGENVDTMPAFNKAKASLELVRKGADFAKIAKDSSEDDMTKKTGGELPYLTSLSGIIRQVEDAAYTLKVGEVYPTPIRSRFVYFVIKLIKEEPKISKRVQHILVPGFENEDSLAVLKRADSLVAVLKGKPATEFGEAARTLSIDKESADKGGDVGGFYSRSLGFEVSGKRLLPEFEEKMFSLKDGEIGIVSTLYGTHVIRCDSTKGYMADSEREQVKKLYKKYFFEEDKRAYLDEQKNKLGYGWNESTFLEFMLRTSVSKSTSDSAWYGKIDPMFGSQVLYKIPNNPITVSAFADSLRKRNDMRGVSLNRAGFTTAINKMTDPMIINEASKTLEVEYPDFASLLREFRDGILLFKVEEQEIWSKLKFDSTLARTFYDSTKSRYMTENKYDVTEIYCLQDTTAKMVYDKAKATKFQNEFEQLAELYTQRAGYREKKGNWGVISVKNSKLAQLVDSQKPVANEVLQQLPFEKGYSVVRINATYPPRQKTFEEAIPDFAPQFQDLTQRRLSNQWINQLRAKYPVDIKLDVVNSIFKQ